LKEKKMSKKEIRVRFNTMNTKFSIDDGGWINLPDSLTDGWDHTEINKIIFSAVTDKYDLSDDDIIQIQDDGSYSVAELKEYSGLNELKPA
jgi:phage pi2 protein 07